MNPSIWHYILLAIIIALIIYVLYKFFKSSNTPSTEQFTTQDGEIILYYTNWCKFSQMFQPEWNIFEQQASKELPNIKVSKVLCENGSDALCTEKGVTGYPTVILYTNNNNKQFKFNKARKTDELIKFIKENTT